MRCKSFFRFLLKIPLRCLVKADTRGDRQIQAVDISGMFDTDRTSDLRKGGRKTGGFVAHDQGKRTFDLRFVKKRTSVEHKRIEMPVPCSVRFCIVFPGVEIFKAYPAQCAHRGADDLRIEKVDSRADDRDILNAESRGRPDDRAGVS